MVTAAGQRMATDPMLCNASAAAGRNRPRPAVTAGRPSIDTHVPETKQNQQEQRLWGCFSRRFPLGGRTDSMTATIILPDRALLGLRILPYGTWDVIAS